MHFDLLSYRRVRFVHRVCAKAHSNNVDRSISWLARSERKHNLFFLQRSTGSSVLHQLRSCFVNGGVLMKIIIPMPKRGRPGLPSMPPEPVHTRIVIANPQEMITKQMAEQGRRAWAALHSFRGGDPKTFLETVFVPMIPQGGCSCIEDYSAILAKYPPDFSSPDAFFAWGVTVHNLVNIKINEERGESRRIYTVDEAYRQWRLDDDMES